MFWVGFVSPENKLAGKWKELGGKGRISSSPRTPSPFWLAFWAEENALRHFPHLIAFNRRSRSTVEQRWCTLYDCKIFSRDRLMPLGYVIQKGARFSPDSLIVNIDPKFCRTIISFYSMQKLTLFTDSSADRLNTSQLLVLSHLSINEKQIENNQKKTKTCKRHEHIRT